MENNLIGRENININQSEVLRYLQYRGQEIDKDLRDTIGECIAITKNKINPRYLSRIYPIKINKDNIVELEGTNLNLESKDIYELLKKCSECVIMAATIGIDIEKEIKRYSYSDLTKGLIIDSCGTTAIEEVCDIVQDNVEKIFLKQNKFITMRYSPGYGDLPIEKNIDILNVLDAQKQIGLTITSNGIMIPRKSVVAIIGISNTKIDKSKKEKSCENCKNYRNCTYRKGANSCGNKTIYEK
ncbi:MULTISPECIES: vitamin B12 dependent-methionine synthase activation domain-containing protein [unclassified Clostridioides]|uniref:vitamin B12 dependent-methionine synthase activation domain-containing protein n=1 Tax=unclassified Clostridioides TaxID=2635829 RepID=UPI001D116675|nr:Vitamin B12 dependent methionine synthase, activation domain protein [Clostridioides sp. ES-S-0171-01]MCC0688475.1 Vitamin B12 dependent methionine synthase, activation domain protein [Clostridioides sp. ES-S-0056-01]MCC0715983.1 Vitamin B12 dependent methionine synthase, activation domain protein [Clostridioides sp. ES-S-0077-01]UDN54632.1 Vitamin B12 dependent methionine synthase, activation domain protein [Clostridioides sp. ES-S-0054-01]